MLERARPCSCLGKIPHEARLVPTRITEPMYLEHFGLSEPPFTITPHTEFFFAGANRGATLEALIYAISHGEGIVKVSGEVGSGKTMLCRVLMERLPANVETVYLAIPSLNRDEMLGAICADLAVPISGGAPSVMLRELQGHLLKLHSEGKRVVALIDEAHAMPLESLEEIRLLSNLETNRSKLLQIALFGQPELDENLALPQMRQLRERITHSFSLSPLTPADVHDYLRFRLHAAGYRGAEVFNPACVKLIAKASKGLSRRVNIIADKSLLAAYTANTDAVTPAHVLAAVRDCDFARPIARGARTSWTSWLVGSAALAAGILLGLSLSLGSRDNKARTDESERPATETVPKMPTRPPSPPEAAKVIQPVEPVADTGAEDAAQPANSVATPPGKVTNSLNNRLAATREWLAKLPQEHLVIQLMLADGNETARIEQYIRDSEQSVGPDRIYAYPLNVNGTAKISVIYGDYSTRDQALKALAALPPAVMVYKPYIRSIQSIRGEAAFTSQS
jgi:MSHA biogenesis protein MshM